MIQLYLYESSMRYISDQNLLSERSYGRATSVRRREPAMLSEKCTLTGGMKMKISMTQVPSIICWDAYCHSVNSRTRS